MILISREKAYQVPGTQHKLGRLTSWGLVGGRQGVQSIFSALLGVFNTSTEQLYDLRTWSKLTFCTIIPNGAQCSFERGSGARTGRPWRGTTLAFTGVNGALLPVWVSQRLLRAGLISLQEPFTIKLSASSSYLENQGSFAQNALLGPVGATYLEASCCQNQGACSSQPLWASCTL